MTGTATVTLVIEGETEEAASAIADMLVAQMDVPVISKRSPAGSEGLRPRRRSDVIHATLCDKQPYQPDRKPTARAA